MKDNQRVYPVNLIVMHHAVSDFMKNWSDLKVQDWFSNTGKSRAYQNGAINPMHEHPGRPGQLTYSQAQYCLHEYTADNNKYGWRLTTLIKLPFDNVAWHAGAWSVNQRSLGIETAGNYLNKVLPDKALMLIADTFRAHDKKIGGKLDIGFHKQFYATACPGRIAEQYNKLIDMFNNPKKWNDKLWPSKPSVTSTTTTYKPTKKFKVAKATTLVNIPAGTKYAGSADYKVGAVIDDVAELISYSDGKKFYRTAYARDTAKKMYGFVADALQEVPADVITKKTVVGTQAIKYEIVQEDDSELPVGETKVVRPGENGVVEITIEETYTNGKLTDRKEIGRKVAKSPLDEIVAVGTKSTYPNWFVQFWEQLIDAIKSILGK